MPKSTFSRILRCPFCGEQPAYDKTNQVVHCENLECALSDYYINTEEWNRRALKKDLLIKYLFDTETVYKGANFYKTQEYVCRCCGASDVRPSKMKHRRNCEVKQLLEMSI